MFEILNRQDIDALILRQVEKLKNTINQSLLQSILCEASSDVSLSPAQQKALDSGDEIKIVNHVVSAVFQARKIASRETIAVSEEDKREVLNFLAQANQLVILAGL